MIGLVKSCAECRQQTVADELFDHSGAARDRSHHYRQVLIHHGKQGCRIVGKSLGQMCEVAQVCKQRSRIAHADSWPFAIQWRGDQPLILTTE
jgi:hypothetical protein